VDDLDAYAETIVQAGGKIVLDKRCPASESCRCSKIRTVVVGMWKRE